MNPNTLNFLLTLAVIFLSSVDCIMFHLYPNSVKCLKEENKNNELVTGTFEITTPGHKYDSYKVDVIVTDSNRHTLYKREDAKSSGKFSFVTEQHDVFEVCFHSRAHPDVRDPQWILLHTKRSVEARHLEGLAEASVLKPMEVELKKLEGLADSIVKDFMEMREREKQMRDTNESTNNRVFYLSVFSLVILIGLAVWQVLYLKKYFKAKKLI